MAWILAAMFFPGLLVYIFTKITYNHFVGLCLSVALICASAYAGYTDTWPIIIIDACSLTFGLWLSIKLVKKEQITHQSA
ncbi:MAG: CsbA family protein [Bacillus sp. (in: firmicutes)]